MQSACFATLTNRSTGTRDDCLPESRTKSTPAVGQRDEYLVERPEQRPGVRGIEKRKVEPQRFPQINRPPLVRNQYRRVPQAICVSEKYKEKDYLYRPATAPFLQRYPLTPSSATPEDRKRKIKSTFSPTLPLSQEMKQMHQRRVNPSPLPQNRQRIVRNIPALGQQTLAAIKKAQQLIEKSYYKIGALAESLNDFERAIMVYEHIVASTPYSVPALTQLANVYRICENYDKAISCLHQALDTQPQNQGEIHASLGHCFLMKDDLDSAFQSYQQAISMLPQPIDSKLWYGIGILYDRWNCFDNAEVAFNHALKNAGLLSITDQEVSHEKVPFEKAAEVYFRLGVIYKQVGKYDQSLTCFRQILDMPPSPLTSQDVQFQMGHCYEQKQDLLRAKQVYEYILSVNENHPKALQQLAWIINDKEDEKAIQLLERASKVDHQDAHTFYLLGRCHMAKQRYKQAHHAYQQAVYRDPRNPSFWCSIGVLYFQIRQYRDALEAYTRAIRINPNLAEVWYDLGTLYESCNNQQADALDAYDRASKLDPENPHIRHRLSIVRRAMNQESFEASNPVPIQPQAMAFSSMSSPANVFNRRKVNDIRMPQSSHVLPSLNRESVSP